MTKTPTSKKPEPPRPFGRPSAFKPEYIAQAQKLCAILGATDLELADFFNVCLRTIWNWQTQHPEFRSALKLGKDEADNRVEKSLYSRAVGYSYDAVKVFCSKDGVTKVNYREHMPPDTTACTFWLKNRRPEQWREKSDVAVENVIYAIADHPPTEDEWIAKHVTQH